MTTRAVRICVVPLIAGLLTAAGHARQLRPVAPQGPATGVIVGRVVDARDGRSIPDAIVSLESNGPAMVAFGGSPREKGQQFLADRDGRFVINGLVAGNVSLSAIADGYQRAYHGQPYPEGFARRLTLEPGEARGDVVIALRRYAVITGAVRDEGGAPVAGVAVRALRRTGIGPATRLSATLSATTDDRGVYRISKMPAGDYIVSIPSTTVTMPVTLVERAETHRAAGDNASILALNNQLGDSGAPYPVRGGLRINDVMLQSRAVGEPYMRGAAVLVQPSMYFPETHLVTRATVLTLAAGDERTGIDFQIAFVRGFNVSGTLAGPEGPLANAGVSLLPAEDEGFRPDDLQPVASTATTDDGSFRLAGVPPGSYRLRSVRRDRSGASPALVAIQPVTVGGSDVAGVDVTLRAGASISGAVIYDGTGLRPNAMPKESWQGAAVNVRLQPVSGYTSSADGTSDLKAVPVDDSNRFTIVAAPPGKYLVIADARGWTLKSIMLNGRDVSQIPVDLDRADLSGAVVTFVDRPATLRAVVRDAKGAPQPDAIVYVFPANYREVLQAGALPRRLIVRQTDAHGVSAMGGFAPDEYLVAAIDLSWFDTTNQAAVIEKIAPGATRVTLAPDGAHTLELVLPSIPPR